MPVGEDQKQHLELARDIAQKFNNDFAESIAAHGHGDAFFPLPEPMITGPATRVMSLRDGTKKMSKSDASDFSRINLTDDADTIAQKIRKAKTDPEPLPSEVKGLAGRPEAENLVGIYAALAGTSRRRCCSEFGGAQFSTLQAGAGRARRREARADRRGDAAAAGRSRPYRRGARRRRGAGARDRRADHARREGRRRAAADEVARSPHGAKRNAGVWLTRIPLRVGARQTPDCASLRPGYGVGYSYFITTSVQSSISNTVAGSCTRRSMRTA